MKEDANIIRPADILTQKNFGTFYNTCYKRFVRYAFYYLNDMASAEDIAHDAILYYWENREKIAADTDVVGYIMLTVKHKCMNYLKHLEMEKEHHKRYLELQEWEIKARLMTLETPEYSDVFMQELMELITVSLSKLPAKTREIFILHRLKYKSRKEIAAELDVSLQKIDYHINKANNHLINDLKDYLVFFAFFCKIFCM